MSKSSFQIDQDQDHDLRISPEETDILDRLVKVHCAFARWVREATAARQNLGQDRFQSFNGLEQLPSFDPGELEEVHQSVFPIPPSARADRKAYTFAFLKLIVRCLEDRLDGDYMLGTSTRIGEPHILVARVLRCNHLVFTAISASVEGNLVNMTIRYAAYDSRLSDRADTGMRLDYWHEIQRQWYVPRTQMAPHGARLLVEERIARAVARTQMAPHGARLHHAALTELTNLGERRAADEFETFIHSTLETLIESSFVPRRELQQRDSKKRWKSTFWFALGTLYLAPVWAPIVFVLIVGKGDFASNYGSLSRLQSEIR